MIYELLSFKNNVACTNVCSANKIDVYMANEYSWGNYNTVNTLLKELITYPHAYYNVVVVCTFFCGLETMRVNRTDVQKRSPTMWTCNLVGNPCKNKLTVSSKFSQTYNINKPFHF